MISWTQFHYKDDEVVVLPPLTKHVLTATNHSNLCALLSMLHPNDTISYVTQLCHKLSRVSLLGKVLGSELCRTDRSAYIAAFWPQCEYERLSSSNCTYNQLSVGKILFFIQQSVSVNGNVCKYVFAFLFSGLKSINTVHGMGFLFSCIILIYF